MTEFEVVKMVLLFIVSGLILYKVLFYFIVLATRAIAEFGWYMHNPSFLNDAKVCVFPYNIIGAVIWWHVVKQVYYIFFGTVEVLWELIKNCF